MRPAMNGYHWEKSSAAGAKSSAEGTKTAPQGAHVYSLTSKAGI
jgi:hypothetical protein